MKNTKKVLTLLIFIVLSINVLAVNTCINTTDGRQVCFESDSNIYQQNVNLYEGENSRYGVYITNPSDSESSSAIGKFVDKIKGLFDNNKIDVENLGDETTFQFQSSTDFFNTLQESNALGNVTLFTQKDLNKIKREKTYALTSDVVNWTFLLLVVIKELILILLNVGIIIIAIFTFFRMIPWVLNQVKILTFKFIARKEKQ